MPRLLVWLPNGYTLGWSRRLLIISAPLVAPRTLRATRESLTRLHGLHG